MCKLPLIITFFILMSVNTSYAKSITIDARFDMATALEQYRDEITDAHERSIRKRFRILIDARKGFDVGTLRLPRYVKKLHVSAVIYVYRGRDVSSPISINLFKLNKRVIAKINTKIRG
ncbi:hypothetical protein CWB89_06350 [Pseudoalteromonas piscicida]|uniref:Uncharacterized protein n=1 Tax=Pseudoalteromonas piscicida TaxID=43662 RepID=A0AAQ2EUF1_PSEO7|nr:hypothetical protein TW75_06915 [Pseudoalteromonas piscicida]TMN84247.1 hypothetical protein CWB87_05470 [Pseudoalteromonas flavipulchra]TMN43607.1 hypothetical protein CWB95_05075 [Pseudoalteromonas piscicida]TMN44056.1 hypothetical protein CWB94_01525 [Pseudoalteromonas piscicida]TMN56827.1 hypothetical protein CWB92_01680 [Pseudoalteromonas piscicida]